MSSKKRKKREREREEKKRKKFITKGRKRERGGRIREGGPKPFAARCKIGWERSSFINFPQKERGTFFSPEGGGVEGTSISGKGIFCDGGAVCGCCGKERGKGETKKARERWEWK